MTDLETVAAPEHAPEAPAAAQAGESEPEKALTSTSDVPLSIVEPAAGETATVVAETTDELLAALAVGSVLERNNREWRVRRAQPRHGKPEHGHGATPFDALNDGVSNHPAPRIIRA